MVTIPKRISLVSQVADGLCRGIREREWIGHLPSEGDLAKTFQVGRMTIRAAVKILRADGMIQVRNGQRARIVGRPAKPRSVRLPVVGILWPEFEPTGSYLGYHRLYCDILQEVGVRTRCFAGRRYYRGSACKALESLIANNRLDLWIIVGSSRPMQEWLAARKIPVILDGACISQTGLPALDVDNRGTLRHAVGLLRSFGHRRITFLTGRSMRGGDFTSVAGFEDGCKLGGGPGVRGAISCCDETAQDIRLLLERIFSGPAAPTGLISGRPGMTLHALSYLLDRGFRIPRDVSIISRDDIPLLRYSLPSITRYSFTAQEYARRLAHMTLKHFDRTLEPVQQFVVPSLVRGNSVGPAPVESAASRSA